MWTITFGCSIENKKQKTLGVDTHPISGPRECQPYKCWSIEFVGDHPVQKQKTKLKHRIMFWERKRKNEGTMREEDRKVIGRRIWNWGDWRSCGKGKGWWKRREADQGSGEGEEERSEANWRGGPWGKRRRFRANREGWRIERVSMGDEWGREGLSLGLGLGRERGICNCLLNGSGGCCGEARTRGMRILRWGRFGLGLGFGCCRRILLWWTCGTEPLF